MMDQSTKEDGRTMKSRALRFQRHRLPRKSRMPVAQRLTAWLIMILMVALVLVLTGGRA